MLEQIQSFAAAKLASVSLDTGLVSIQPLAIFVVGMVLYSVFIFKFYRFVAGRDVFKQPPEDYPLWKKFLHIVQFVFFYPLLAFFWFLVISLLLASLSETITIGNIFLASMATIATIRVSAYYNEDLSKDIAKLVPFGLLAVMLLDLTRLSIDTPLSVIYQLPTVADTLLYYFLFVVLLEFGLRVITWPVRHRKFIFKKWKGDMKDDD
jgi:hypothetical protein